MNYKLNTDCGNNFHDVSKQAQEISMIKHTPIVEFDFNGVKCIVNKETNLEWLWRDYINSHLMEWKVVGPDCLFVYEPEVQEEYNKRKKLSDEKQEKQRKEWEAKERKERELFEEKTKGVEIRLADVRQWNEFKEKNKDPYGACCVEYAEGWAKLMQIEIKNGSKISDCAERTSHELGFLGVTGFMYGCAVSMLSQCWEHGEELRKWHNIKTQIRNEGELANESGGVLNPALLSIG